MRKTKIICTIGPATRSEDVLKEMVLSGMNVARLNFSHGSWDSEQNTVDLIKKVREELNEPVAILLDTKGPEIRLKEFLEPVILEKGQKFTLRYDDIIGSKYEASITYKNLYQDVKIGDNILLDDGKIKLKIMQIFAKDIICEVLNQGEIISNKGINVPEIKLNLPSLTEKDIQDIEGAVKNDLDYIAASFVRQKEDVLAIRKILTQNNSPIKIIAKIENKEGLENFDEILEVSDGIMVARGDLGVEIPFSKVPIVQKEMIKKTFIHGKIVITATQMLESMIEKANPTRAEVSDIANAIFDGTSAIMLSGETAVGKYPIECIKAMDKIALDIEDSIDYWHLFRQREYPKDNFEFIINHALLTPADDLNVKAIFAYTKTSDTPRILASMRPKCPIYVSTSNKKVFNQLALSWGINIRYIKEEQTPKDMIMEDILYREKNGLIKKGDIILIAGGKYILKDEREINKNVGGIFQI